MDRRTDMSNYKAAIAAKKTNLRAVFLRFAPVLWPPSDFEVSGRKERKRNKKERKLTHSVRTNYKTGNTLHIAPTPDLQSM